MRAANQKSLIQKESKEKDREPKGLTKKQHSKASTDSRRWIINALLEGYEEAINKQLEEGIVNLCECGLPSGKYDVVL